MNADGQHELVVTYRDSSNTYNSQIYSTVCSASCSISLWSIDYTTLSGMEAVPFIFDRFSNGSVSVYTFRNGERVIVTAISGQKVMFFFSYLDIQNYGQVLFKMRRILSILCLPILLL